MKLSSTSKPLSSPGRTEKFPPPLMRFLRSNVSSRSRGRSRASPLFMKRKKAITSSTRQSGIETQEPSSPKVTCMGQVRVRRSKNSSSSTRNNSQKNTKCMSNRHCCCFPKSHFCSYKFPKPKWPEWVFYFSCRSAKVRTDSSKNGSSARFEEAKAKQEEEVEEEEHVDDEEDAETDEIGRQSSASATATTTPPKNAFLLTRCRSAPYRSSSLACRFWGEEETREQKEEGEEEYINKALEKETMLLSSIDSTSESRGDQDSISRRSSTEGGSKSMGVCAQEVVGESSFTELKNESVNVVDHDDDGMLPTRSLMMLMRSKSEPARRGLERFDPQSSEYWRLRRLGNTENCTPHAVD